MVKEYAVWDQRYWPFQPAARRLARSREDAIEVAKASGILLPVVEEWHVQDAENALARILCWIASCKERKHEQNQSNQG